MPAPDAPRSRARRALLNALLALAAVAAVLAALEIALAFDAHFVRERSRIYQVDGELGWAVRPNLDVPRRIDELTIRYATDANGYRIEPGEQGSQVAAWRASDRRRVLIVGDSFAEGNVNVSDRLDRFLSAMRPDWSVLMVGASGYGTDQVLILAQRYLPDLREGDVLVMLSCGNDFRDLIRSDNSGRSKPYFRLEDGALRLYPPSVGLREWIREASYLASFVLHRIDRMKVRFSDAEMQQAGEIYRAIVAEMMQPFVERGVHVVIAHHTDWLIPMLEGIHESVADGESIHALALDEVVLAGGREGNPNLLSDAFHWSPRGNALVASVLERFLADLLEDPRPRTAGRR